MTVKKETPNKTMARAVASALASYNSNHGTSWNWGTNWSNIGTEFETFCIKYLFPKITETEEIRKELGNRFEWLAKEVSFIGQLNEEYTYKDIIPISLNLSKNADILLRRNYPQIITKLYSQGEIKKNKITLNNNDMRLNFMTLMDGVNFVLSAYKNIISGFNVAEETEIKAMIVDYSLNQIANVNRREVTNIADLATGVFEAIQNVQNNSHKYNEAFSASGGGIGRYTTKTSLSDVMILTTDKIKTYLLDTKIANTFNNSGLDFMNHVCSFDDLGGAWRLDNDVTATSSIVNLLRAYGDYQTDVGDILAKGSVFTFDITIDSTLKLNSTEIKPDSELYALVLDIRSIRYRRSTKDMMKEPFINGEYDEVTHNFHYYSQKSISPFYNKILITGKS